MTKSSNYTKKMKLEYLEKKNTKPESPEANLEKKMKRRNA